MFYAFLFCFLFISLSRADRFISAVRFFFLVIIFEDFVFASVIMSFIVLIFVCRLLVARFWRFLGSIASFSVSSLYSVQSVIMTLVWGWCFMLCLIVNCISS